MRSDTGEISHTPPAVGAGLPALAFTRRTILMYGGHSTIGGLSLLSFEPREIDPAKQNAAPEGYNQRRRSDKKQVAHWQVSREQHPPDHWAGDRADLGHRERPADAIGPV